MSLRNLIDTSWKTSWLGSGRLFGDGLVESYVAAVDVLIAEFAHGAAQIDAGAVGDINGGELVMDEVEHLGTADGLHLLTCFGLAETGFNDFRHVLLLHELLVELLDADDLVVVEPVGRLLLTELVEHLGVELLVVNLARVVDELAFGYRQADVATAASCIGQRMGSYARTSSELTYSMMSVFGLAPSQISRRLACSTMLFSACWVKGPVFRFNTLSRLGCKLHLSVEHVATEEVLVVKEHLDGEHSFEGGFHGLSMNGHFVFHECKNLEGCNCRLVFFTVSFRCK